MVKPSDALIGELVACSMPQHLWVHAELETGASGSRGRPSIRDGRAEGFIPEKSVCTDRELVSHEDACILNAGDEHGRDRDHYLLQGS
jgi:hypothetical protein